MAKEVNTRKLAATKANREARMQRETRKQTTALAKKIRLHEAGYDRGDARRIKRQGMKKGEVRAIMPGWPIASTAIRKAFEDIKVYASAGTEKGQRMAGFIWDAIHGKHKPGVYKVQGWNASLSFKTAKALNAPIYDKTQYPTRFDTMCMG